MTRPVRFQSLSGFLRPCNSPLARPDRYRCQSVSIPIGFSQALQPWLVEHDYVSDVMFQSLSGFLRPCNAIFDQLQVPSDAFQSLSGFLRPCNLCDLWLQFLNPQVSIPIGFSQALQRLIEANDRYEAESFQSLSGFLRPCNPERSEKGSTNLQNVSIPIGFSQALQPVRSRCRRRPS